MLKLVNVNKVFGKRNNTLHVLNNISLELPNKGLVAICGESGCGKTTLLNCIGGNEKAQGEITVDNLKYGKSWHKIDKFRSKNIGYIYQDYCLLEDKSIRENLQLAIDIARTSDDADERRMSELLDIVGMGKYLKRKVSTLSGGQKQRVAIARALINNPRIILADEPTGHLDNDNTVAIMDILKELSSRVLVIWVSHEKELVQTYADRIIEIDGGKIKNDYINNTPTTLNLPIKDSDNSIYLEEYSKSIVKNAEINAEVYTKNNSVETVKLIVTGNKIFINAPNGSDVQIIQSSRIKEKREREKVEKSPLREAIRVPFAQYTGKRHIQKIAKSIFTFSKKRIIAIIGFIFAAIFLAISMSFLNLKNETLDYEFLQFHKDTVQIDMLRKYTEDDLVKIRAMKDVVEVLPYNSQYHFEIKDDNLMQSFNVDDSGLNFNSCMLKLDFAKKIKYGRLPQNQYEIIIDEMSILNILDEKTDRITNAAELGYTNIVNFLNTKITWNGYNDLTVVGISESFAPAIYVDDEMFWSMALNQDRMLDKEISTDLSLANIVELANGEVYIDESSYLEGGYDENNNELVLGGEKFKIAGTYNNANNQVVIMNAQTAESLLWKKFLPNTNTLMVLTSSPLEVVNLLIDNGYNANSVYEIEKLIYEQSQRRAETVRTILTIVVMAIVIVIYWMTEKSKILTRMDEISVKRLLGETKTRIFAMFLLESMLTVTIFAVPAYLLTVLLISSIAASGGMLLSISALSVLNVVLGILILLVVAVFTTLLSCMPFFNKSAADLRKVRFVNYK